MAEARNKENDNKKSEKTRNIKKKSITLKKKGNKEKRAAPNVHTSNRFVAAIIIPTIWQTHMREKSKGLEERMQSHDRKNC